MEILSSFITNQLHVLQENLQLVCIASLLCYYNSLSLSYQSTSSIVGYLLIGLLIILSDSLLIDIL